MQAKCLLAATVELASSMTALEVSDIGKATKVAIRVEKFLDSSRGETKSLLSSGAGGSQEYLVVSGSLEIGNFSVPLPNGFRMRSAQLRGVFSGRFPIHAARERFAQSVRTVAEFAADRPPDPKAPEMRIQGAVTLRRTSEVEL